MRSWSQPHVPSLQAGLGRGMELELCDTASQNMRTVDPDGHARMYVCGITPYDATHLGHAATYVTFDLIHRMWLDRGLEVTYVQNVTDIDDPLLERAAATNQNWEEIAQRETEKFRSDMEALGVIPPQHYIGAVEAIPLVHSLLDSMTESTYQVDSDIYYDITQDHRFGELSHYSEEHMVELCALRGGDPNRGGKKNKLDCVVWQAKRPGEPSWESARGEGRPGWHIECAAIALEYLGTGFDIQGGGSDLIFPHHEMSASQARAASGSEFAQHFVHTAMVGYQGEKMSKSLGNLVFVSQLLSDGVEPAIIRTALLNRHYRHEWEFSDRDLDLARNRIELWRAGIARDQTPSVEGLVFMIRQALSHDLDAPRALRAIDFWAQSDGGENGGGEKAEQVISALLGVQLSTATLATP